MASEYISIHQYLGELPVEKGDWGQSAAVGGNPAENSVCLLEAVAWHRDRRDCIEGGCLYK